LTAEPFNTQMPVAQIEGCQAPHTIFAKAATQGGETCEFLET
jgi:hypothetical protein